jgi:hypothetical protein
VIWLNTPGDVLAPERLLARDTVGYVEWTADLDDPGTRELLDALVARGEAMQRRAAPEGSFGGFFEKMQQWNQQRNEQELRKLFPVVLAAAMRPSEDGSYGIVVAGSARGMDHQLVLADWIGSFVLRRANDAEVLNHAGETILVLSPSGADGSTTSPAAFLRGGDFYVASTVAEARRTIDVLVGRAPEAAGDAVLSRWYAEAPDTVLRGALSNDNDELAWLWNALAETDPRDAQIRHEFVTEEPWGLVEGAVISGGLDDAGAFAIDVTFDLTSAAVAERAAPDIVAAVTHVVADSVFRLESTAIDGDRLRVRVATESLAAAIERIPVD